MPINPFLNDNTNSYGTPNTTSNYDDKRPLKIAIIVFGLLIVTSIIILAAYLLVPKSQDSKYTNSATAAARKQNPNADVAKVKVSGNFALGVSTDSSSDSQGSAGNTIIFKINSDGSMTQIAEGSSFTPIDLLNLGISFVDQAKLTGNTVEQTRQTLADACGYTGGSAPGFNGFDGSFNPDNWQIDSTTLESLEQSLTTAISTSNGSAKAGKNTICVNAIRDNNSSAATDTQTYISTFTLHLQFITSDGSLSTHTLTFAVGPHYYHQYTLDGQVIE